MKIEMICQAKLLGKMVPIWFKFVSFSNYWKRIMRIDTLFSWKYYSGAGEIRVSYGFSNMSISKWIVNPPCYDGTVLHFCL